MRSKPVPLVTDWVFNIRTPAFMVIYGHVLHVNAVEYNAEKILQVGNSVGYKRHGTFQICCIHEGHAVIRHTTLSGKIMHLLVPE